MKRYIPLLLAALPTWTLAQEAALYDAPPPADAAFVRFLAHETDNLNWQGLTFELSDSYETEYFIVHAPAVSQEVGSFLNVLPNGDVLVEPQKDISKVTIGLINLSDSEASLKTGDGKVDIIGQTGVNAGNWREVNPVQFSAAVVVDGNTVYTADMTLIRGEHQTFVIQPSGEIDLLITAFMEGVVE